MKPLNSGLLLLASLLCFSCSTTTYDLAITNIRLFDAETGMVQPNQTILITRDRIVEIADTGTSYQAIETIEGRGRLVTPGFIDTHIHLSSLFGEYDKSPEFLVADSLPHYRQRVQDTYLKHGTTTVAEMGGPDKWMNVTLSWQNNPSPDFPDLYIAGGALISDEERTPYRGHEEVFDPESAKEQVKTYAEAGVHHLKLYWRLREPEMKAVIAEANAQKLQMFGHIDENGMSIQRTMEMGLRNFEHMLSTTMSVFSYQADYGDMKAQYAIPDEMLGVNEYLAMRLLQFKYIKETPKLHARMIRLLEEMAKNKVTLSTTIHLLGSVVSRTEFNTTLESRTPVPHEGLSRFSEALQDHVADGFSIMMAYMKMAHDMGVSLRIGTDCVDGGRALHSEVLLMTQYGFSLEDALQIATINGAKALHLDKDIGTIGIGKKANLILFEKDPFQEAQNLISDKLVIKDGLKY